MSAETVDQSNDNLDVESEAREMGWVPHDQFRGDKSKWIDADQFVEHGRKVMPILKKNNQELIRDMSALRLQVNHLTKDLEGARDDLTTYQEFHQEELTRRVKETREEIMRQLETAHEENDSKGVARLTGQLTDLAIAQKETDQAVNGKDVTDAQGAQPQLDPAFLAWQGANPAFDRDPAFTYKAMAIAATMRQEGITTSGKEWFDEVDRRLKDDTPAPRSKGKVESSKGGSSNSVRETGATYSDLPPDAKAACDKFAQKFVGPNRTWKTVAEYRKHYAEVYSNTN